MNILMNRTIKLEPQVSLVATHRDTEARIPTIVEIEDRWWSDGVCY